MTQVQRKVTLMAHSQLASRFASEQALGTNVYNLWLDDNITDGQIVALSAIRTCYSHNKPSEIARIEGKRYFTQKATDGGKGSEADRLIRTIMASKHTSTMEHSSFTFAIEGISRALLAQLTRHRVGFSFSVQSQRYVKFGSNDRSGGFDYVLPETVELNGDKPVTIYAIERIDEDADGNIVHIEYTDEVIFEGTALEYFDYQMREIQRAYDALRALGVPAEDCRAVLPNAAACNLVMTANLTALIGLYSKRRRGNGAQLEVAELVEDIRNAVVEVEPWADALFEGARH